jgi:hypothetical protein
LRIQINFKKNIMKKIILFSAFLIAAITVNAQTSSRTSGRSEQPLDAAAKATKQTEKMDAVLTLTASQKEKVYAINLEKDKAIETAALNKETLAVEKKRINEERKKEIAALLTPEQLEKAKKMAEEKQATKK